MPTPGETASTTADRHTTLRQVFTALLCVGVVAAVLCVGVVAAVLGLMSRHAAVGAVGLVAVAAVIAALVRLPAPSGPEHDGAPE